MAQQESEADPARRPRIAYLDVCVHKDVRRLVLSSSAAFLLSAENGTVMWANARGVRLLGASTVRPLVEGEVPPSPVVVRQIEDAVADAAAHGRAAKGTLRARTDFRTRLVGFEARPLSLQDIEDGILVVTDELGSSSSERMSQVACDTLDGYGHASAVIDAAGRIVARSAGFDALRIGDDTLQRLVDEVAGEDDRLVKRPIRVAGGEEHRAAGIARLADDPAVHMLIVASRTGASKTASPDVETDEDDVAAPPGAEVDGADEPHTAEPRHWFYRARKHEEPTREEGGASQETGHPFGPGDDATDADDLEDLRALDEAALEQRGTVSDAGPVADEADEDAVDESEMTFTQLADAMDAEENIRRDANGARREDDGDGKDGDRSQEARPIGFGIAGAAVGGGLVRTIDHTDFDDADSSPSRETVRALSLNEAEVGADDPFEDLHGDDVQGANGEGSDFTFERHAKATRFVWSLDRDKRFRSVSDELARVVGPSRARLEGRTWSDVAADYGFDDDGAIDELLTKGDTWSGRKVMWPVEGEDLRVPVDLAGLPAFGRERTFEGFNGFGIVHTDEAVPAAAPSDADDDEIDEADFVKEAPFAEDDDEDDRAQEDELDGGEFSDEADEPTAAAAVIDLDPHRRDGKELSNDERRAFERIGERLSTEDGEARARPDAEEADEETDEPDDAADEVGGASPWRVAVATGVDTSILERLPVPVVAYRGTDLLFANEPFVALTGYEGLEVLAEEGGIDRLFGDAREREGAPVLHRDGHALTVQAHLQSVPWDDARATLLTLRNPPRGNDGGGDESPDPKPPSSPGGTREAVPSGVSPSAAERTPHLSVVGGDGRGRDEPNAQELRSILDTAADGVLLLDRDGTIRDMNRSAEALFDMEGSDAVGSDVTVLLAPESHRSARDYVSGLSGTGVSSVLNDGRELIGRTRGGGLVPLFVTMGPIAGGTRLCAVMRDMTHWKRTEEDLVAARAEAMRESESKTQFLAHMSHELRTPLNAIIGFSEMMIGEQFGPLGNDRYLRYCQDIRRSGEHVLDIVNDLLDISKIEAGSMDLDFDAISLNTVVTETAAMMQAEANGERVVIRTSLDADLPQIVADARSMRQVLINLVANAIQFTEPGGQVIVSTSYDAGDVTMRVRDTGVGMTSAQVEKALLPFQQVRSDRTVPGERRRGRKGTGLGLPLTKALAEANRARFTIESEPHEGTLVELRFPAQRVLAH